MSVIIVPFLGICSVVELCVHLGHDGCVGGFLEWDRPLWQTDCAPECVGSTSVRCEQPIVCAPGLLAMSWGTFCFLWPPAVTGLAAFCFCSTACCGLHTGCLLMSSSCFGDWRGYLL
jgi:hypothetical protein